MDPYEALGVTPATPLPEIETAYRLLLRQCHPDLHHGDGPQAVADAEQLTRRLTLAMAHVRADHRDGGGPSDQARHRSHWPRDHRTDHGPRPGANQDWGGNPRRGPVDEAVPCPYCNQQFRDLEHFMHHLTTKHHGPNPAAAAATTTRTYRQSRFIDFCGSLRFIPNWLLAGMIVLGVCFQQSPNVWLVTLLFVLVVSWAKTSRRYKRRSGLNHL